MRRRALVVAILGVLMALGAAACGIPTDDEPQPLADETPSSPALDPAPEFGDTIAIVYLVSDDQLVRSERAIDGGKTPETVLGLLLLQTTEEEQADGLQTLIPQGTAALSVTHEGEGTWAVDMSSEWGELNDPAALYAYGQVVLTLTELAGVEAVRFSIDGADVDAVPTVNNAASEVVEAADYAALEAS